MAFAFSIGMLRFTAVVVWVLIIVASVTDAIVDDWLLMERSEAVILALIIETSIIFALTFTRRMTSSVVYSLLIAGVVILLSCYQAIIWTVQDYKTCAWMGDDDANSMRTCQQAIEDGNAGPASCNYMQNSQTTLWTMCPYALYGNTHMVFAAHISYLVILLICFTAMIVTLWFARGSITTLERLHDDVAKLCVDYVVEANAQKRNDIQHDMNKLLTDAEKYKTDFYKH